MMKTYLIVFLFVATSVFAQHNWIEIHDSELDTLTGQSADSTLEEVSLTESVFFGYTADVVPRTVLIVTQYTDISNGEGVTQRDGFGDNSNNLYSGFGTLDTLATAPSADDTYTVVDVLSNPGNAYQYSLKQYESAVDTDSLAVRRYIFGLY